MNLHEKYANLSEEKQVEIYINWIIDTKNKYQISCLFATIKCLSGPGGLAYNNSLIDITEELPYLGPEYLKFALSK